MMTDRIEQTSDIKPIMTEKELFEHLKTIHGAGTGIDWRSIKGEKSEGHKAGFV